MIDADADTAMLLLAAASRVIDGVQDGMRRRGFTDVRPAHGFAFVRIAAGEATTIDVAAHLGVTKQAASQLVDQLVRRGYVARHQDQRDARRRILVLTDRGRACTQAAEESAAELVGSWRGRTNVDRLHAVLRELDLRGRCVPRGDQRRLRMPARFAPPASVKPKATSAMMNSQNRPLMMKPTMPSRIQMPISASSTFPIVMAALQSRPTRPSHPLNPRRARWVPEQPIDPDPS